MQVITKTITVGDKTYSATKIDFDQYYLEKGQMTVGDITMKAIKVSGVEDSLLCGERILCSETTIVG